MGTLITMDGVMVMEILIAMDGVMVMETLITMDGAMVMETLTMVMAGIMEIPTMAMGILITAEMALVLEVILDLVMGTVDSETVDSETEMQDRHLILVTGRAEVLLTLRMDQLMAQMAMVNTKTIH